MIKLEKSNPRKAHIKAFAEALQGKSEGVILKSVERAYTEKKMTSDVYSWFKTNSELIANSKLKFSEGSSGVLVMYMDGENLPDEMDMMGPMDETIEMEGEEMEDDELMKMMGMGGMEGGDAALGGMSDDEFSEFISRVQKFAGSDAATVTTDPRVVGLEREIRDLKRKNRLVELEQVLQPLTTIPGTSTENAIKIMKLEEAGQPEVARELITTWETMDKQHQDMQLFSSRLSPGLGTVATSSGPAEVKMQKWADTNEKTFAEASAHFQVNDPATWTAFRLEKKPVS